MNQLLEKIKLWFLNVYDKAAEFCREKWDEQRTLCIAVLACVLLIIILLILIPSLKNSKKTVTRKSQQTEIEDVEIDPYLALPIEPAIEDDYVFSRKNITRWSDDAVNQWFSEPDDEMLGDLKKANDKLVEDMLEVVP